MLKIVVVTLCALVTQFSEAAQIYRCKTYQGGLYWSSDWCSKTNGITVNTVSVPDGMSFDEQARMGDQLVNAKQVAATQESSQRDRARTCGAIDRELAEIWSRYKDWQFNSADQIGRDQTRTRELNAQRSQLGCQTR